MAITFSVIIAVGLVLYDTDSKPHEGDFMSSPAANYRPADLGKSAVPVIKENPAKGKPKNRMAADLLDAVVGGEAKKVNAFLDLGVDVNTADDNGDTPLIFAAIYNYKDVTSLLIRRGANVKAVNKTGNSALIEAAATGNAEIVQSLLANGADAKLRNVAGKSAADVARQNGYNNISRILTGRRPSPLRKPMLAKPGSRKPSYTQFVSTPR